MKKVISIILTLFVLFIGTIAWVFGSMVISPLVYKNGTLGFGIIGLIILLAVILAGATAALSCIHEYYEHSEN